MKLTLRFSIVLVTLALICGAGLATASAQGSVHVVQFGDTLGALALRYNTTVSAFVTVNHLPNPNVIYVGQVLTIPATGGPVTPPPASGVHIVQSGENLFRIGLLYGFDVNTLAAANGLANPNRIYVGQRLIIPQPRYYVVQWGDYLSAIARSYGSSVTAIMTANGITNPNLIYPGQRLLIP
jgi:LysM repeat protein